MKLKLEQKNAVIDGSNVAYVEATLMIDKYTYRVLFDKQTKKRFNAYCKTLGFKIGKVEKAPEKVVENDLEADLPL